MNNVNKEDLTMCEIRNKICPLAFETCFFCEAFHKIGSVTCMANVKGVGRERPKLDHHMTGQG